MKNEGIRIKDNVHNVLDVKIQDILMEIKNGEGLCWSILFFTGNGTLKDGKNIQLFEVEANKSENGVLLNWNELMELFWQLKGLAKAPEERPI